MLLVGSVSAGKLAEIVIIGSVATIAIVLLFTFIMLFFRDGTKKRSELIDVWLKSSAPEFSLAKEVIFTSEFKKSNSDYSRRILKMIDDSDSASIPRTFNNLLHNDLERRIRTVKGVYVPGNKRYKKEEFYDAFNKSIVSAIKKFENIDKAISSIFSNHSFGKGKDHLAVKLRREILKLDTTDKLYDMLFTEDTFDAYRDSMMLYIMDVSTRFSKRYEFFKLLEKEDYSRDLKKAIYIKSSVSNLENRDFEIKLDSYGGDIQALISGLEFESMV